jgi:hypothetical protein
VGGFVCVCVCVCVCVNACGYGVRASRCYPVDSASKALGLLYLLLYCFLLLCEPAPARPLA